MAMASIAFCKRLPGRVVSTSPPHLDPFQAAFFISHPNLVGQVIPCRTLKRTRQKSKKGLMTIPNMDIVYIYNIYKYNTCTLYNYNIL